MNILFNFWSLFSNASDRAANRTIDRRMLGPAELSLGRNLATVGLGVPNMGRRALNHRETSSSGLNLTERSKKQTKVK